METKEYNFQKICRACLSEDIEMQSVFECKLSSENSDPLADFYHQLTTLKIAKGDGLPENLCSYCVADVLKAYRFAQLCISTDETLRLQRNRTVFQTIQKEIIDECNIEEKKGENKTHPDSFVETYAKDEASEEWSEMAQDTYESLLNDSRVSNIDNSLSRLNGNVKSSQKKKFSCSECRECFSTEVRLRKHEKMHDPSRAFKCLECLKTFTKKSYLTIHSRSHIKSEEKQFICDECGQQFTYSYLLNQHSFKHKEVKPFPCTKCDKGCLTSESLRRHMRVHDENYKKKKHICSVCHKEFPYPSFLSEHMKNHTGERPFLCNICGKGFRQNGALEYHMRSHTGLKPFSCHVCNENFMSQSVLKVHMRRHTNERPYVCDICGKAFRQSTDMKSHKRTHTGDKPVLCTICGKRMSTTGQLTIHIRSHTGEKPFSCKTCSKAFATRTMLVKHERIHTGERPYVCSVCGRAFNQSSTLKTHINTHKGPKKLPIKEEAEDNGKTTSGVILNMHGDTEIITKFHSMEKNADVMVTKNGDCLTILPAPIPLLQNL